VGHFQVRVELPGKPIEAAGSYRSVTLLTVRFRPATVRPADTVTLRYGKRRIFRNGQQRGSCIDEIPCANQTNSSCILQDNALSDEQSVQVHYNWPDPGLWDWQR
jgi:hypothetical protein